MYRGFSSFGAAYRWALQDPWIPETDWLPRAQPLSERLLDHVGQVLFIVEETAGHMLRQR